MILIQNEARGASVVRDLDCLQLLCCRLSSLFFTFCFPSPSFPSFKFCPKAAAAAALISIQLPLLPLHFPHTALFPQYPKQQQQQWPLFSARGHSHYVNTHSTVRQRPTWMIKQNFSLLFFHHLWPPPVGTYFTYNFTAAWNTSPHLIATRR